MPTFRFFRVGGLRFLRLGRLQVSWCVVKRAPRRPDEFHTNVSEIVAA